MNTFVLFKLIILSELGMFTQNINTKNDTGLKTEQKNSSYRNII